MLKKYSSLSLAVMAAVSLTAFAQATETLLVTTLTDDQYNYASVADGGTREVASVFAFENAPPPAPQFQLDYHAGMMLAKWDIELPVELVGKPLEVTSATLVVHNIKDVTWDPTAGETRVFGVGFNAPLSQATWNENTPYEGPEPLTAGVRNPFVVDLTGANAQNIPSAAPWAVGVIDPVFDGTLASSAAPFAITFEFDVNDPAVQSGLVAFVEDGEALLAVAASYVAVFGGGPPVVNYPQLITKEGAANPAVGTPSMAPTLLIAVREAVTSVADWQMFH